MFETCCSKYGISREQKIGFFGRFIAKKSVFGRLQKNLHWKKSEENKLGKNGEKSPIFFDIFTKFPIFHRKIRYFSEISLFFLFVHWLKKYEKIALEEFRTHPKCLELTNDYSYYI